VRAYAAVELRGEVLRGKRRASPFVDHRRVVSAGICLGVSAVAVALRFPPAPGRGASGQSLSGSTRLSPRFYCISACGSSRGTISSFRDNGDPSSPTGYEAVRLLAFRHLSVTASPTFSARQRYPSHLSASASSDRHRVLRRATRKPRP
jgi:hypothetical protein